MMLSRSCRNRVPSLSLVSTLRSSRLTGRRPVQMPIARRRVTTCLSSWSFHGDTSQLRKNRLVLPIHLDVTASTATPQLHCGFQASCFSTASAAATEPETKEDFVLCRRSGIRNVAVIAHVDHGKTTLVDQLLLAARRSSGNDDATSLNRLMDSGELEIERGITITSKVTRLDYHSPSEQVTINCVDTPGHSDFSGEVDRILSMVDGVVLVVDAAEGPMTQTKYVLSRALALGLKPLVVLNKCDRSDAIANIETSETESKLLDLFDALGANEEQMDYRTLYASAREGWVTEDPVEALELAENGSSGDSRHRVESLLEAIMEQVPEPAVRSFVDMEAPEESKQGETFADDKFSLAAVTVGYDQFLGRTCTGRIFSGSIKPGDEVTFVRRDAQDSSNGQTGTVAGLFVYLGTNRTPLEGTAHAGDIVTVAGVPDSIAVGDTLTGSTCPVEYPIETPPLAPPTLSMDFGANNGPLAGKEGTLISASKIRDRLFAETDNNVTLSIEKSATDSEKTMVFARGELQLGILVEQMRREGFELIISPPRILTKTCPDTGHELEPYEEVTVDVDSEYSGSIVSALTGDRKGVLIEMLESSDAKSRLIFEVPSRALLGFNSEIATATKGSAVVTHLYIEDRAHAGNLGLALEKGKLVSNSSGKATSYALSSLVARGELFVAPGDEVYPGMVIGESAKAGPDMEVNCVRAKEKTNMRTQAKDEKVYLPPPKRRSVEELIGYMNDDEIIEVTPASVRLRKLLLDASAREQASRNKAKALRALKGK